MTAGLYIFIAFIAGSILKIGIPYYNKWKIDGRPFNLQYLEPIAIAMITAFPVVIAAFIGWNPPLTGDIMALIAFAFLAGWGQTDGIKALFEYMTLINTALNKAQLIMDPQTDDSEPSYSPPDIENSVDEPQKETPINDEDEENNRGFG